MNQPGCGSVGRERQMWRVWLCIAPRCASSSTERPGPPTQCQWRCKSGSRCSTLRPTALPCPRSIMWTTPWNDNVWSKYFKHPIFHWYLHQVIIKGVIGGFENFHPWRISEKAVRLVLKGCYHHLSRRLPRGSSGFWTFPLFELSCPILSGNVTAQRLSRLLSVINFHRINSWLGFCHG